MYIIFLICSCYLFYQAFRFMSMGWKTASEVAGPVRVEEKKKQLPRPPHPEMADVKEGDELLVVNFRELQPPRPEEEIADRFKLDSPELHNLGDPLNKDLKDRIKELEEEDDGEGYVVGRR